MPPAHSSHSLAAPDSTIFFSNHWVFISWWGEDCQIIISWSLGNVFFKLSNYISVVMPRERFILTTQRLVLDHRSPGRGTNIREHYAWDFTDPDSFTHILDSHRPHWFSILDFLGAIFVMQRKLSREWKVDSQHILACSFYWKRVIEEWPCHLSPQIKCQIHRKLEVGVEAGRDQLCKMSETTNVAIVMFTLYLNALEGIWCHSWFCSCDSHIAGSCKLESWFTSLKIKFFFYSHGSFLKLRMLSKQLSKYYDWKYPLGSAVFLYAELSVCK